MLVKEKNKVIAHICDKCDQRIQSEIGFITVRNVSSKGETIMWDICHPCANEITSQLLRPKGRVVSHTDKR